MTQTELVQPPDCYLILLLPQAILKTKLLPSKKAKEINPPRSLLPVMQTSQKEKTLPRKRQINLTMIPNNVMEKAQWKLANLMRKEIIKHLANPIMSNCLHPACCIVYISLVRLLIC